MAKFAIITLTYNKLEQATKSFLNSLYEFTDENCFDFFVVDNASTDGTVDYLKDFAQKNKNISLIFKCQVIFIIFSKFNVGFFCFI